MALYDRNLNNVTATSQMAYADENALVNSLVRAYFLPLLVRLLACKILHLCSNIVSVFL